MRDDDFVFFQSESFKSVRLGNCQGATNSALAEKELCCLRGEVRLSGQQNCASLSSSETRAKPAQIRCG